MESNQDILELIKSKFIKDFPYKLCILLVSDHLTLEI
jgi:hypothetical protein